MLDASTDPFIENKESGGPIRDFNDWDLSHPITHNPWP